MFYCKIQIEKQNFGCDVQCEECCKIQDAKEGLDMSNDDEKPIRLDVERKIENGKAVYVGTVPLVHEDPSVYRWSIYDGIAGKKVSSYDPREPLTLPGKAGNYADWPDRMDGKCFICRGAMFYTQLLASLSFYAGDHMTSYRIAHQACADAERVLGRITYTEEHGFRCAEDYTGLPAEPMQWEMPASRSKGCTATGAVEIRGNA